MMKKSFRRLVSIALIIFVLCAATPLMASAEDEKNSKISEPKGWTILAENNFDKDNSELGFEYSAADISVASVDKEHGNSLKIGQNMGNKFIGKYFPKGLSDGRYCFSFSLYCENLDNIKLIRLYNENAETVMTSDNSAMVLTWSGGSYNVRRTSSWVTDYRVNGSYEINKWYDLELWLDTVNNEVLFRVNGDDFICMKYQYDIKTIKGFSFVQEQQVQSDKASYIDNLRIIREDDTISAGFDPVYIRADTAESIVGNNFYNNCLPHFSVSFANRLAEQKRYRILYSAVDSNNNSFWENDDELILDGKETVVKSIDISTKHYGVNKLVITLISDNEKIAKEIKYSLSNNSINNPRNIRSGACTHLSRAYGRIEEAAPLLANAGFGVMRGEELPWIGMEATKGVYTLNETMKKNLKYFNDYGLKFIQICNSSVSYYQPEGIPWNFPVSTPEGYKALEKYAEELSRQAGDTLLGVEVWNEYHNKGFSGPFSTDPKVFAQLHRSIYKGLQAGNPNVLTIGFDEDPWGFIETKIIQQTLKELNGEKAFDAISLHPYALEGSPLENNERLDGFVSGTLNALEENGYDKNIPLYITEFGWPDSLFNFDAEKRAAYVIRAMAYYQAKYPNLASMCNYNLFDYADVWSSGSISEGTFGLVESYDSGGAEIPHLAKPLYVAFAYWNNLSAENTYVGSVEGIDPQKEVGHIFKDRSGQNYIVLANLEDNNKNIGLDLGCDSAVVSDIYGNEEKIYATDGVFSLTLNKERVTYIRGNFDNTKITEPKISLDETSFSFPVAGTAKVKVNVPSGFKGSFKCEKYDILASAENAEIANGNAEITLKALENPKDGKILFTVTDDGKLYYKANADVVYSPSGQYSNLRLENSKGDALKWDIVFDVKNIRNDKIMSGSILSKTGEKLFKLPVFECGETREIRIPYKDISNISDITDFYAKLDFDTGDFNEIERDFKVCAADFADKPPQIDGKLENSEWQDNAATIYLNAPDMVRNIVSYQGEKDLSAKCYLKYDLDNFYFAADVTDDVFYQPNNNDSMWAGDSIQFSIGFDIDAANTTQYAVGKSADIGPCIYRYTQEGNAGGFAGEAAMGLYENGECAVSRVGEHTFYEVKIPWNKIKVDGGSVYCGKKLYFAAIVNDDDNDGTGRGWIQLCDAIGNSVNTASASCEMYLLEPGKK